MKHIPFGKPIIGSREVKAINAVLRGNILVHGPRSSDFENMFRKFTGAKYALTVSSCTAGMHLIYFSIGLSKGDEVIVPAQTHTATAHAVELTGAKAIFVDVDKKTGNVTYESIKNRINKKTKAIAVVHFLGVPVDLKKIKILARKKNIFLLEDCALSVGAKYEKTHTGLIGDAGVFSFYPVKHITSGEGGMIITKNKKLYEKLKLQKAFGIDRDHNSRKIPGMYDAVKLGFNYRMSELHAAIGIEQMKKIQTFLKIRRRNFDYLKSEINKNIKEVQVLEQPNNSKFISSCYCLSILLPTNMKKKRTHLIDKLKSKGIGSSIYYPQPVPRMTYYKKKYGYNKKYFPNAEYISDHSISLPIGPHVNKKQLKFISSSLSKVIHSLK